MQNLYAVLDQGLFAGTNFLLNILLARWLTPQEYGSFVIVYAIYLLFGSCHTALITEPMSVFGVVKYKSNSSHYFTIILYLHIALTTVFTIILLIPLLFSTQYNSFHSAQSLLILAITMPITFLYWLIRRAYYTHLKPGSAASTSLVYCIALLSLILVLYSCQLLSPELAFVAMALASLVASLRFLRTSLSTFLKHQVRPALLKTMKEHWFYGKWALGSAVLTWVPSNLYYTFLPMTIGLEGTAALRSIMNLLMPMLNILTAISMPLLPHFVSKLSQGGREAVYKIMRKMLFTLSFASLLYWLLIGTTSDYIFMIAYRGNYTEYARLTWLAGILLVLATFVTVLGTYLRAIESPRTIFRTYCASAFITLTAGLLLAVFINVAGAIIGIILSSLSTVILMAKHIMDNKGSCMAFDSTEITATTAAVVPHPSKAADHMAYSDGQ